MKPLMAKPLCVQCKVKKLKNLNYLTNIEKMDLSAYRIPSSFFIKENPKPLDNLPSPDYEFDGGFIGRKNDLRIVKSTLYGDLDRVITISGAGGVGKTALALARASFETKEFMTALILGEMNMPRPPPRGIM